MKKLTLALSVLSLSIASSFAQADTMSQEQKVSGFYLGGTVGSAKGTSFTSNEFQNDNSRLNLKDYYKTSSETSFQLLAGYQFNRIVAVEFVYTDFGNLEKDGSTLFKPTALTAQANVGYSFHSGWRPFALAGLSSMDINRQQKIADEDDSKVALRTGLGVEFAPASLSGLAFRATWTADWGTTDYSMYKFGEGVKDYTNINMLSNLSIGATYKF